jgi:hypothetical protein
MPVAPGVGNKRALDGAEDTTALEVLLCLTRQFNRCAGPLHAGQLSAVLKLIFEQCATPEPVPAVVAPAPAAPVMAPPVVVAGDKEKSKRSLYRWTPAAFQEFRDALSSEVSRLSCDCHDARIDAASLKAAIPANALKDHSITQDRLKSLLASERKGALAYRAIPLKLMSNLECQQAIAASPFRADWRKRAAEAQRHRRNAAFIAGPLRENYFGAKSRAGQSTIGCQDGNADDQENIDPDGGADA